MKRYTRRTLTTVTSNIRQGSVKKTIDASSEVVVLHEQAVQHELERFCKQMFGSKPENRLEECPDQPTWLSAPIVLIVAGIYGCILCANCSVQTKRYRTFL